MVFFAQGGEDPRKVYVHHNERPGPTKQQKPTGKAYFQQVFFLFSFGGAMILAKTP